MGTRENETAERKNPINLLDVQFFDFGKDKMVMKDGRVTYRTPIQGENYEVAKKQYDDMVSSIEDMTLMDFVSRYKDAKGEIDSKYIRIISALRNAGIVYNQILDMTDSCIKDDGSIDKDRVLSIVALKKAGALSDDINGILEVCQKTPEGKYDVEDVKHACDLTQAVIGGKEVCALLPDVKADEGIKEFIIDSSPYVRDKSYLLELLKLAKTTNNSVEPTALEVIFALERNLLDANVPEVNEKTFLEVARGIVNLARDNDGVLTDDAAGICVIMSQNRHSAEEIKKALVLCTTHEGIVDAKLSEILWQMCVQEAPIEEIEKVINVCVNEDKSVNSNNADMLISLFEAKFSKDKILSFISK